MPVINLEKAISLLKNSYSYAMNTYKNSPFFFIVGAGISADSIPTASKMAEKFAQIIKANTGKEYSLGELTGQEQYSKLFEEAFPEPIQRRDYLYQIMKDAAITEANFSLAHFLKENKQFTNLIITPNFDNLLSKALLLFQEEPLLYDHPDTFFRFHSAVKDKTQIVHIHGTFRFYDCCNLQFEIDERAKSKEVYYRSPVDYLNQILTEKIPIVIGYNGWDDVIRKSLITRLKYTDRTSFHYYWLCYDETSYKSLHKDIKFNDNFYIIINDSQIESIEETKQYDSRVEKKIEKLPAEAFFSALNSSFSSKKLELFEDPVGFFTKQLESIFPKQKKGGFYNFESVKTKLEDKIKSADVKVESPNDAKIDHLKWQEIFKQLNSLGTIGKFIDILNKIDQIIIDVYGGAIKTIESENAKQILKLIYLSLDNLYRIKNQIKDFDVRNSAYNFIKLNNHLFSYGFEEVAILMNRLGRTYYELGKYPIAQKLYEIVVHIDPQDENDTIKVVKSHSWYQFARVYLNLGKTDLSLREHEKVFKYFKDSKLLECQENAARSLFAQGYILDKEQRYREANDKYQEIINRFSDEKEIGSLKITLANSYLGMGRNYIRLAKEQRIKNESVTNLNLAESALNKITERYSSDNRQEFKRAVYEAEEFLNEISFLKEKYEEEEKYN